jgi:hypothetical protein
MKATAKRAVTASTNVPTSCTWPVAGKTDAMSRTGYKRNRHCVRRQHRTTKEEQMVRRLSIGELVTAVLLLTALTWAAVQLGPIAIERWF